MQHLQGEQVFLIVRHPGSVTVTILWQDMKPMSNLMIPPALVRLDSGFFMEFAPGRYLRRLGGRLQAAGHGLPKAAASAFKQECLA